MSKKITALFIMAALVFSLAIPAMATAPAYFYEAQKLVNPVTFDGVNDGEEWADAVKLVINADNSVMKEWGRFQAGEATADELSATYYIKWDDEFLYICEERLDVNGLNNPEVDPSGPWMGDGTAFFFADGNDLTRADIRWIPYTDQRDKNCAVWSQPYADEVTADWQCFGAKSGNVYTIELAMPWSVMGDQLTQTIKEGAHFRFCPIVTSRASDDEYGEWGIEDQMNFYDSFVKFDLANSEDSEYHAGLRLVAANYTPPAAEVPEENVPDAAGGGESAPEAPAVPVPTAPRTGDAGIITLVALAAIASLGIVVLRRKPLNIFKI